MPTLDLTDDEHAALTAAARKAIVEDRYTSRRAPAIEDPHR
jgi:hypothetical protein